MVNGQWSVVSGQWSVVRSLVLVLGTLIASPRRSLNLKVLLELHIKVQRTKYKEQKDNGLLTISFSSTEHKFDTAATILRRPGRRRRAIYIANLRIGAAGDQHAHNLLVSVCGRPH
jgi:hypothetical protein